MPTLTLTKPNLNLEIFSGTPEMAVPCIWFNFIKADDINNYETTKSFSNDIEKVLFFLEDNNCAIKDLQEVKIFLEKHFGIIKYLFEAPSIIFKYFGHSDLKLDLIFDLDIEDSEGELILTIETKLDAKSAYKKLNEIDEKWLMNITDKEISFLNLNLKFR